MTFTNMNVKHFIDQVIVYDNVDNIINVCKNDSEKGFIFERLYDIIIKFGFCDVFNNSNYDHLIGNSNIGSLKKLDNLNQYLEEKVISSNTSGISDITLYDKFNKEYIFFSCKYFIKEKSADNYDIHKIIAMITSNNHIYTNYKIYLAVQDKNQVLDKFRKTNISSEYLTRYVSEERILDKNDLNKYFKKFKQSIIKNKNKNNNWNEIYCSPKDNLNLRFHQELITQKTCELIEDGYDSFLWGCKCRSGKTYMIGGMIIKQLEIKKKLNVLIITPVPTETIPQFTEDLFNKFRDFYQFKVHHLENSKKINNLDISQTNNIFIVSKQLLERYIDDKIILSIKNLELDIIAFDENHFAGTTEKSKNILKSYVSKNTVKIYLTATYKKPLEEWNIISKCRMFWDIEDEKICKTILEDESNLNKLNIRHTKEYVDKTIKYFSNLGLSINDIFKCYEKMPELHLITNMFDQQRYETIKKNIEGSSYGFSFEALFSLNDDGIFRYNEEIKIFLRYISGSEKELDFKSKDKSILSRIKDICSRPPYTQIWFLPPNNIDTISKNLKLLMLEDKIFKNYNVMCINSKNEELITKNIKDKITNEEKKSRSEDKRGLIILAGNMLSLGITIDSCDIVMLMNSSKSFDKVMQQMYRCMTEGINKTKGFVVDLNINSVLETYSEYMLHNNNISIDNKFRYIIENRLINIDNDLMKCEEIDSDTIVKKLMDIWRKNPSNNIKRMLERLKNDIQLFDNPIQKIINETFSKSISGNHIKVKISFKNDEDIQDIQTGQIRTKDIINNQREDNHTEDYHTEDNQTEDNQTEDNQKDINISFTKHVLPYIIPLTCILTIKDSNTDFVKMLIDIKENTDLLETFDEQCYIYWNKKDLIDMIKEIIDKYLDKNSETYNMIINMKTELKSLIDKPKELIEMINECLVPKDEEKKKYGEVFTPIAFINNNMLKDIEDYWLKTYGENIWTNDKLTWYDPAAGMGNYSIAIYYKLLDGLKENIPDEDIRKKHIIEKQLYMGELNKKNCSVIKQIFNMCNDYKLNLYQGDTLTINLKDIFKISKFDIIIGNPPYNEELTNVGAKPLYNKFIEYYINKCDILSFIVPSRWFSGGKGLDKFREMMLKRKDIVYINHYRNACQIFGNKVNIEGGVSYFLIDKKYSGICIYNGSSIQSDRYDIIIDNEYYTIIDKLSSYDKITKLYLGRYYGIESNDKRLMVEQKQGYIKCYVSLQKDFIKYIKKEEIKKPYNGYKIITARANGKNGCFGNTFIGNPNEVHSGSYISFGVQSEEEAKSLISYMKCKLPNFMLSLRKISQDISENTCKWIPLVPFNRYWTDKQIYDYFKLSQNDIQLIKNKKIVGYKEQTKIKLKKFNINKIKYIFNKFVRNTITI